MLALFDRLTKAAEARSWSAALALSSPAWVTALRLLGERFLAAETKGYRPPLSTALHVFTFYVALLFVLSAVLARLVPVAWRRAQNLVDLGLLLGVTPPLIDTVVLGRRAFSYEYASTFGGVPWALTGSARTIPPGETFVLWTSVVFMGLYAWRRTGHLLRGLAVSAVAYALVLGFLVQLPSLANDAATRTALAPSDWHLVFMAAAAFFGVVVAVGGERRLLARLPQAVLPPLFVVLGAALRGTLDGHAWLVAAVFALAGWGFALSNDFHDRVEDAHGGRVTPIDDGAAALLSLLPLVPSAFILTGRLEAGLCLFAFAVVAHAYQADPLRLKCVFPLSYKTEGLLAGVAMCAGLMANPAHVPTGDQLWALLLVAVGTPAALVFKDWKDVDADAKGGVQTAFVFGEARGWPRARTLAVSAGLLFVSLAVPVGALLARGASARATWVAAALAVVTPALLVGLRRRPAAAVGAAMLGAEATLVAVSVALLP